MKTQKISQVKSSGALVQILGNVEKYSQIAHKAANGLSRKYPNPNLIPIFSLIPKKLITICPMALCDDLTQDLDSSCSNSVLGAVGLSCLSITTHDDVVDETPTKRSELASLVYAGNIAALEGIKTLYEECPRVADTIVSLVNENHYYQQYRVDLLWENKPKNFNKYIQGIYDVVSLAKIGPACALSLTGRTDIEDKVHLFASGFGNALQIIDDIREVEEDRINGYTSFPVVEGPPFSRSFRAINKYLHKSAISLEPEWVRIRARLQNLVSFANQLEKDLGS